MELGFIGWIVVGLVAGAIAKLILPGRQGGGIIATLILGVVGGLLGGFIGSLFGTGGGSMSNPMTWILAVVGSIIVLLIWGLITGRKAPRD
ncbi:GlsB/YeaQ/YmgE family stress response membrane protein [Brevibacterium sp. 5221]|uniref:GlsB/YeaQ/YmgE family stress response membrane protein n=1 Tax=Brevibacterium rongguiense TaxID=2695267 RepID=A0A6N9H6W0_9MICO|nr:MULTISPECIES: GlsB/YeaQ/YmgE family stress response membrane protein [Brevibacterium]MYM19699.1 GlsB/YeaQ/YmgE family stress response membrane protein [Brevibacterium rongguiense]WAL39946.1 GlsB/YeaQ/YmgE family stress response membrane protein [Brevibacterium sp. BRM-1]